MRGWGHDPCRGDRARPGARRDDHGGRIAPGDPLGGQRARGRLPQRSQARPGLQLEVDPREHATADFGWDFEWRGVQLYDTHYPGGDATPDRADAPGNWTYSYADNFGPSGTTCNASGPLQSAFEGDVIVERGTQGKVDVMFEFPNYTNAPAGCYDGDFWRLAAVDPKPPVVRDVPTFPSAPIERPVSDSGDCSFDQPDTTVSCTLGFSGTVTITPR